MRNPICGKFLLSKMTQVVLLEIAGDQTQTTNSAFFSFLCSVLCKNITVSFSNENKLTIFANFCMFLCFEKLYNVHPTADNLYTFYVNNHKVSSLLT